MSQSNRLKLKDKCIYGLAGIGDGTAYCMVATFLMFFLTSVAGIAPAPAGTIVAIGSLWDVCAGPFVGYLSDNCRSRFGRRRPFIFVGAIPLALGTALLFTAVDFSPAMKAIFYGVVIIIYWSGFSCFFVPYAALGSELTTDYDERTSLRGFTSVCNSIGNILGTVTPSIFVGYLMDAGCSTESSWSLTATGIAIFSGAAVMITALGTGNKDVPRTEADKTSFNLKHMFCEYLEILKLKPMLILVLVSVLCLTGLTMFTADRLYFFTYVGGYSQKQISFILLIGCLSGFLAPPLISLIIKFMDRKSAFIAVLGTMSILIVVFRFWEITTMWQMLVLMFIFGIGYMSYWQLLPTLVYDICEYDEYVNGKQRGGELLSLQGLAEGLAEALGSQLLGILLQIAGFISEAKTQSAGALAGVHNCMLVFPSILILISCVVMWRYPITREKFKQIQKELEERKSDA